MWAEQGILRLMAVAASGATVLSSACSAIDVKHNIVTGTMDFIAGYAGDLLGAVVPASEDYLGGNAP